MGDRPNETTPEWGKIGRPSSGYTAYKGDWAWNDSARHEFVDGPVKGQGVRNMGATALTEAPPCWDR